MSAPRDRFVAAILAGDYAAALAEAREVHALGVPVLYEDLIVPSLTRVGQLWQEGRLSVADEHVATAITQSVMAAFYPTFPWNAAAPKAIVACVAGERHELGARMVADLLVCDGWNVRFVGADAPVETLLQLALREKPVFVGLSAAMPGRLPSLRALIASLRSQAPSTRILVGGRGTAGETAATLAADELAPSAASAVEVVRSWMQ